MSNRVRSYQEGRVPELPAALPGDWVEPEDEALAALVSQPIPDVIRIVDSVNNQPTMEWLTGGHIDIDTLTTAPLGSTKFSTNLYLAGGFIASDNYVVDETGWAIDYAGNAEFNNLKTRGLMEGATLVSTDGMNMIENPTCATDTSTWTATTNCSIARKTGLSHPSTSTTTALQITASAAGICTVTSDLMMMDNYAGMAHGVSANWQETSGTVNSPNTLSLIIDWYDMDDVLISSSTAETQTLVSGTSYRAVFPGTQAPSYSPDGSVGFRLRLVVNTANNSSTVVNVTDITVAMIGSVAARVGTFERLFVTNPGSGITTATINGGTSDPTPLLIECASATMTQQLINNTAFSTSNSVRLDFYCNTSVQSRPSLRINTKFTDVTDATRTSTIILSTAANGTFADVMAFLGNNVGIGTTSPGARAHIQGDFLGNIASPTVQISSTASNDDPSQFIFQDRVATTNATITTLTSLNLSTFSLASGNLACGFQAFVTGRCSTAIANSCTYSITGGLTLNGVPATTMLGTPTVLGYEGNAGTDCIADVTGTTLRIRVTGLASNNFVWHVTIFLFPTSA